MNTHIFTSLRRRIGAVAALALTLALTSGCSGSLADDPGLPSETPSDVAPVDSILRFPSIADLESITPADLPGDFAGYELTDLSYECVDTIELRALRLDVTAGLTSPAGQKRTLTFTADVGPELVSVEYYPCAEVQPPHDNFLYTSFWPHIERYRNYSDGSRIGPDLFYDYGHFLTMDMSFGNDGILASFFKGTLRHWEQYYKDGIHYTKIEEEYSFNLNTTVFLEDGRSYHGADLLPIIPIKGASIITEPGDYRLRVLLSDFSLSRPSRLANDPDGILSMCSDVPDVSPTPFPYDTESRAVGFYYKDFWERLQQSTYFVSSAVADGDRYEPLYCNRLPLLEAIIIGYTQYMVIDRRIIHYRDMFRDFIDANYFDPVPQISKVSDGYMIHLQIDNYMYNEHFRNSTDIHIKTYYGSEQVIDLSGGSWNVPASLQPEATVSSRSAESDGCCPRPDGTYVKVDRRLPSSLESVKQSRTINRSAL